MYARLDYVKPESSAAAICIFGTSHEPAWLCGPGPAPLALVRTGCGFWLRRTPKHPTHPTAAPTKLEPDFSFSQPHPGQRRKKRSARARRLGIPSITISVVAGTLRSKVTAGASRKTRRSEANVFHLRFIQMFM